jgi:hypothetical protein
VAKRKSPHRRLDPDDVLEGRARPGARELLALIHEVNPSGHDHLPAREIAHRYAQKSRLQSLLVRRFGDEILVEPGDGEGVVGLRHRTSGEDACHAVLASLDEDARSWVQRELDLGGGDDEVASARALSPRSEPQPHGPPSDAPLDAFSTGELLRRGRAALDAYDYPAARERFAAACARGDREAALLLLTVLVEHLGLDEDALALEERLDDETLAQPEVRLLLSQSAARAYQRERAVRLVGAAGGDAAAEVFVALARGALERGELADAAGDVAEVQRRAPSHPALLGLADTVKKRRAEERAPLEAEARRLLDEGLVAEAEARAAAIVARWPESTVAHGIARAGQEQRRRDEARALAAQGQEALAQGEGAVALGLLRRAVALGLRGDEAAAAEAALAQAEDAVRERMAWEKCAEVLGVLGAGQLQRGLVEYAALDDVRRAHVRGQTKLDALVYLEQTGAAGPGLESRAAVLGVVALTRAIGIVTNEPVAAAELVSQHLPVLGSVPDALRCLKLAEDHRRLNAQIEAQRRLDLAMDTVSQGAKTHDRATLGRAADLFTQVRRGDLDEEAQGHLDHFAMLTRRMVDRWDRAFEVGKLRKAGLYVAARDALDGLIRFEESGSPEMSSLETWRAQRAVVVSNILRSTSVRPSGAPAADDLLGVEAPRLRDVAQTLLPGGQELVLAEAHAGVIFFLILDVASGRVTRRATLRLREAFEVRRIAQRAGRAVLLGTQGAFIDVDPRTWEMERALGLRAGAPLADESVLAPGGRFAWCVAGVDGWWTSLGVTDTERDARDKPFSEPVQRLDVRPLHGLDEPRVVVVRDVGTLTVHEARGTLFGTTHEGLPALFGSVTVHPSGRGLFALLHDGEDDAPRVRWAELAADGLPLRLPEGADPTLEGLDPEAPCQTALSLDAGVVYVLGSGRGAPDERRLLGFAARGAGIERCFDVAVPARVTLAQDAGARTVVALSPHEDGIEVVRLDASAPTFRVAPPRTPALGRGPLGVTPARPCAPAGAQLWSPAINRAREMGIEYLQHLKPEDRKAIIASVLAPEDEPLIVARYAALGKVPKPALAEEFLSTALARYPDGPAARQLPAQRAALTGDWAAVRDRLAAVDPAGLGDAPAQHHDHLLGVAHLMLGEVEEARRVLARGADRTGGSCDLSVPLALVGDPRGCAGVRALDQAVRAADARLAAGDPGGARRALAGLAVREADEVQTLARMARAWMDEPPEAGDGFVRRLALTRFVVAHAEKAPARRRELPFAGARWDDGRLSALAAEVKAWLLRDAEIKQDAG